MSDAINCDVCDSIWREIPDRPDTNVMKWRFQSRKRQESAICQCRNNWVSTWLDMTLSLCLKLPLLALIRLFSYRVLLLTLLYHLLYLNCVPRGDTFSTENYSRATYAVTRNRGQLHVIKSKALKKNFNGGVYKKCSPVRWHFDD